MRGASFLPNRGEQFGTPNRRTGTYTSEGRSQVGASCNPIRISCTVVCHRHLIEGWTDVVPRYRVWSSLWWVGSSCDWLSWNPFGRNEPTRYGYRSCGLHNQHRWWWSNRDLSDGHEFGVSYLSQAGIQLGRYPFQGRTITSWTLCAHSWLSEPTLIRHRNNYKQHPSWRRNIFISMTPWSFQGNLLEL